MNIHTLQDRTRAMIEATRRKQGTLTPAMIARLNAYAREGVMRKLALLPECGLQGNHGDQARKIDQDIDARMSHAEQSASEEFTRRYCAGAREQLLERLTRQLDCIAEDQALS